MPERQAADLLSAARESGELYRALVQTLPDVVLVFDEQTSRYVVANPAAEQLFGYSIAELLDLGPADLVAPEDLPGLVHTLDRISRSGHWRGLLGARRRDGSTLTLEGVASYLVVGGRGLFQGVFRDVTDRLQVEAAERERARLEGALLAARTAQHELNNQLAMIVGYAELLNGSDDLPEHLREMVGWIQAGGDAAATIVEKLRLVTRLEEVERGGSGSVLDLQRSTSSDPPES